MKMKMKKGKNGEGKFINEGENDDMKKDIIFTIQSYILLYILISIWKQNGGGFPILYDVFWTEQDITSRNVLHILFTTVKTFRLGFDIIFWVLD